MSGGGKYPFMDPIPSWLASSNSFYRGRVSFLIGWKIFPSSRISFFFLGQLQRTLKITMSKSLPLNVLVCTFLVGQMAQRLCPHLQCTWLLINLRVLCLWWWLSLLLIPIAIVIQLKPARHWQSNTSYNDGLHLKVNIWCFLQDSSYKLSHRITL